MSFACNESAKGQAFSLEAMLSLLAAAALLSAASLQAQAKPATLERLAEFQLLNDFLAVRGGAGLEPGYVAAAGVCLKVEDGEAEASFLPEECARITPAGVVSTARIVCEDGEFKEIRASLWRR